MEQARTHSLLPTVPIRPGVARALLERKQDLHPQQAEKLQPCLEAWWLAAKSFLRRNGWEGAGGWGQLLIQFGAQRGWISAAAFFPSPGPPPSPIPKPPHRSNSRFFIFQTANSDMKAHHHHPSCPFCPGLSGGRHRGAGEGGRLGASQQTHVSNAEVTDSTVGAPLGGRRWRRGRVLLRLLRGTPPLLHALRQESREVTTPQTEPKAPGRQRDQFGS